MNRESEEEGSVRGGGVLGGREWETLVRKGRRECEKEWTLWEDMRTKR